MKAQKEKKFDIFDHWANLTTKKEGYKETDSDFVSSYSPFMINRFLSMFELYLPTAAIISKYDLPKETHHLLIDNLLPKKFAKVDFLKRKNKTSEEDDELIMRYFEFGKKDLDVAKKFLTEDDIQQIRNKYGKLSNGVRKAN